MWYGVDINNENIVDNFQVFVWELVMVCINVLIVVFEVVCFIVFVDEIIKNFCFIVDFLVLLVGCGRG